MERNDGTAEWIRTRQRAVRQRVHDIVERTIDGPLAPATRRHISDVPPGLASVVAQISAEITGRDRSDEAVVTVGTAIAFVTLHLRVHAVSTYDGESDAILTGDLLRALADRTICRSSLSDDTVEAVSSACAAASRRGLEEYYRTGDPDAIDASTFVDASRAGAAVSDVDWLPSFVASVGDETSDPASVVPVGFEGDTRIRRLERIVSGNRRERVDTR